MSQQNFSAGNPTQKGRVGEKVLLRIIREIFPGANIYLPAEENGAHQCDAIVISWNSLRIVLVDSKAKPAMSFYPDTGIDKHQFDNYTTIGRRHRALVFLCFIDEFYPKAYGNFLQILKRKRKIWWNDKMIKYPRSAFGSTGHTINFPLDYMKVLVDILPEEIAELKSHSTRNKDYGPNEKAYSRLSCALKENSFHPKQGRIF